MAKGKSADKQFVVRPFESAKDDGLAAEHQAVQRFVEEMATTSYRYYEVPDLKSITSGRVLVECEPQQARRYVLAALAQIRHWEQEAERVRSQAEEYWQRVNCHMLPGWQEVWARRRRIDAVLSTLLRRNLPLEENDLIAILEWCVESTALDTRLWPIKQLAQALERYLAEYPPTERLWKLMGHFARRLRQSRVKEVARLGTSVEQLCARYAYSSDEADHTSTERRPVEPASAGHPAVMHKLKQYLKLAREEDVAVERIGPDHFDLRADSPLREQHALLSELFEQIIANRETYSPDLKKVPAGRAVLELDGERRGRLLVACAERAASGILSGDFGAAYSGRAAAVQLVDELGTLEISLDRTCLFDLLLYLAAQRDTLHRVNLGFFLSEIEAQIRREPLREGERYVLHLLRAALIGGPPFGTPGESVDRLTALIGDGAKFFLVPGEFWADAVNDDLTSKPPARRKPWIALLKHALTATASKPSAKWLKAAEKVIKEIGAAEVEAALKRWLPLVARGRSIKPIGTWVGDVRARELMHEENATCLRGLLWIGPLMRAKDEMARAIGAVAMSAYRKVPGIGPRAVKVGNACIYVLGQIKTEQAVGQLAMLKVRVKFGTAQKEIEKAFNAAAEALGLPRDQIEEMGVPSYGLEEVGLRRESFGGEFSAELRVNGRDVAIHWLRGDGKPQKSVPAKIKSQFKEEVKDLQQACKDVAAMIPVQAQRLDSMFLLEKRWPVAQWRERYLDHPLVGTIARRLIWCFHQGDREEVGIWHGGRLVNVDGKPLKIAEGSEVALWHPIDRPLDDVLAWRQWLEQHEVVQPFKQAHREVYLLTDAEQRTATYSNRFAAHIIRQHQFNALCAARGWKNQLRLMVDASYPPARRDMPNWGLRAEFWVEGIGQDYGTDTTDSGAFLRLATDQVRFYRREAALSYAHASGGGYVADANGLGEGGVNEPLPLEQVPPLVFSEIMRDVDLFVGVASVGNDPTWQDGGPEGRFRDYWHSYSFGELSESARTRRAVLESLLPRLSKIRDRCTLGDKFLVVRGEIRTYKIHLGSGNILMEPNDQYLCIVPNRSMENTTSGVLLPFEGDATLSIILSKAFLLAEDRKITDSTITQQIKRS